MYNIFYLILFTVPCPEIILHLIPIKVRPDSTITFSCVAWSYGGLIYEWQNSGSLTLPNNSAVSYEKKPLEINAGVNTTVYEITIFNVQETDEGHYCCIASNGCGSTTECAWLEVDSKLCWIDECKTCKFFYSFSKNITAACIPQI